MKGIYKRTEYPTAARSAREELGPPPQERIDKEMLQGILSAGGLTKQTNRMLGRLIAEEKLWDEAMELARSDEAQVAFRSAWALEWAYTMDAHPIEARFRRFSRIFCVPTIRAYNASTPKCSATWSAAVPSLPTPCRPKNSQAKFRPADGRKDTGSRQDLADRTAGRPAHPYRMDRGEPHGDGTQPVRKSGMPAAMAAYARRYLRRVTAGRAGGKRNG